MKPIKGTLFEIRSYVKRINKEDNWYIRKEIIQT